MQLVTQEVLLMSHFDIASEWKLSYGKVLIHEIKLLVRCSKLTPEEI